MSIVKEISFLCTMWNEILSATCDIPLSGSYQQSDKVKNRIIFSFHRTMTLAFVWNWHFHLTGLILRSVIKGAEIGNRKEYYQMVLKLLYRFRQLMITRQRENEKIKSHGFRNNLHAAEILWDTFRDIQAINSGTKRKTMYYGFQHVYHCGKC